MFFDVCFNLCISYNQYTQTLNHVPTQVHQLYSQYLNLKSYTHMTRFSHLHSDVSQCRCPGGAEPNLLRLLVSAYCTLYDYVLCCASYFYWHLVVSLITSPTMTWNLYNCIIALFYGVSNIRSARRNMHIPILLHPRRIATEF